MYGLQSGLMCFRKTIHVDLYLIKINKHESQCSFLYINTIGEYSAISASWYKCVQLYIFFGREVMHFHSLGCIQTTKT
jgi:hypothetical protein